MKLFFYFYCVLLFCLLSTKSLGEDALTTSAELQFRAGNFYDSDFSGPNQNMSELELKIDTELQITEKQRIYFDTALRIDSTESFIAETLNHNTGDTQNYLTDSGGSSLDLRNLSWEYYGDQIQITIGKQQIVWGNADGIRVLNVVNPHNYREFILAEFNESRIPQWSSKIDYQWGDFALQFITIFDPQFNVFAESNTPYSISAFSAEPSLDTQLIKDTPSDLFQDGDIGARVSGFHFGWDWAVSYLYHYNDMPYFTSYIQQLENASTLFVEEKYDRESLCGLELANSLGSLTLRNELGVATDRELSITDNNGLLNSAKVNQVDNVSGLDLNLGEETLVSIQWQHTYIDTDEPLANYEKRQDLATFLIQRYWLNRTLKGRIQAYRHLDNQDHLIRSSLLYELNDAIHISLATDLFSGNRLGNFGQFKNQDRFVLSTTLFF